MAKKQNWYSNPRKYHFIYKTTCQVNGKYYYGMHSTDNLEDGYIGSGTRLWHSIKKHGRENFTIEILEFCDDRESLKKREAELITEDMLNDPLCMNLTLGGNGGFYHLSNEFMKPIRVNNINKNRTRFFESCDTSDWREIQSKKMKLRHSEGKCRYDTFKGRKHSDESKSKIGKANSKSQAGERNSQFGKRWMNKDGEIIRVSEEEAVLLEENGWSRGKVNRKTVLPI